MKLVAILLTLFYSLSAYAAFKVVKHVDREGIESILSVDYKDIELQGRKPVVLRDTPFMTSEHEGDSVEKLVELLVPEDPSLLVAWKGFQKQEEVAGELRVLIEQGKPGNRINLTILGDGYTESEREKFFEDAQRITDDLFKEDTFASYLPLFNVYAVFVASRNSGITDRVRKNTAFGLYRSPVGSKRAVMPGKTSAIESALRVAPATDYPIIIANDDYYGGLGGRYAITTRSHNSGSMVLRHELGHNFGDVGEEYDGGSVYRGANFSTNPEAAWGHWLNERSSVRNDSKFLTGAYLWKNLSSGPYVEEFNFPEEADYFFEMKVSTVGWSSPEDVHVYLDGQRLELSGVYTSDRSFFNTRQIELRKGRHTIRIEEKIKDGDNVLAYANGYAYPRSYDFTPDKVAAFNVFDEGQRKRGYRPTHDACLMRDMRSKKFCVVDQENMWLRFLSRVSLIDDLKMSTSRVELFVPPLKHLQVRWYKIQGRNRVLLDSLNDQLSWSPDGREKGSYQVEVRMDSPEVRKNASSLKDTKEFQL